MPCCIGRVTGEEGTPIDPTMCIHLTNTNMHFIILITLALIYTNRLDSMALAKLSTWQS